LGTGYWGARKEAAVFAMRAEPGNLPASCLIMVLNADIKAKFEKAVFFNAGISRR
jgi:hypothetical protein